MNDSIHQLFSLEGRVAPVTGGSRGLGLQIATMQRFGRIIDVNALAPGFFPTKMSKGLLEAWGEDKVAAHSPLGRLGGEDDLKGATLLFAAPAGRHITGQVLAVDGGASCIVGA